MVKVNERFNHLPKIKKELEYIKNHSIIIGIMDDGKKHPESDDITMLELAKVHEFGATIQQENRTIKIPERSFIRTGYDENKKDILKDANKLVDDIIAQKTTAKPAMEALGQVIVTKLQKHLTNLKEPPNAPSTIKQKGSSNPLIDESHLRQAITYKIVRN